MEKPMNCTNIPQTDSIQELADFWDTHDLTDFEDELEEVSELVLCQHIIVGRDSEIAPTDGLLMVRGNSDSRPIGVNLST